MKEIVEMVRDFVIDLVRKGERQATISIYKIKRVAFRFALELVLFVIGAVFLLAGIVLLINRYFPIEWVLLITGLLLLNAVLLMGKFR